MVWAKNGKNGPKKHLTLGTKISIINKHNKGRPMFTILYNDIRKMDARGNSKYSTEYYNGISLTNKKNLQRFCRTTIQDIDFLCDIALEADAINYFHNPSKRFPRDLHNEDSKQTTKGRYRTPYEALQEFVDYISKQNTTGGIPAQMINRWNRVFKDVLFARMLTVAPVQAKQQANTNSFNKFFE